MSTAIDPNFEFNAPKNSDQSPQFHDFTNPTEDENADSWFDRLPESTDGPTSSKPLDDPSLGDAEISSNLTSCLSSDAFSTGEKSQIEVQQPESDSTKEKSLNGNSGLDVISSARRSCGKERTQASGMDGNGTIVPSFAPNKSSKIMTSAASFADIKENICNPRNSSMLEPSSWFPPAGAKKSISGASSTRSNMNLTESILALAGFKNREQDIRQIADSTVAEMASNPDMQELASSVTEDLDNQPVSSRTRSSTDGPSARQHLLIPKLIFPAASEDTPAASKPSLARKSMMPSTAHSSSKSKPADRQRKSFMPTTSKPTPSSATKEAAGRSGKRSHGGASSTPQQFKRARGMDADPHVVPAPAARTPTFSSFAAGSARHRTSSSAARRCQSVPRTRMGSIGGREAPAATPVSTPRASGQGFQPSSAARGGVARATMSSAVKATPRRDSKSALLSAAAAMRATPQLTVPYSPNLATSARTKRRAGADESEQRLTVSSSKSGSAASSSLWTPGRLTVPRSPRLSQRSASRPKTADSDTLQLRQAEEALEQLKKRRKVGEERLKGVLEPRKDAGGATGTGPVLRSTKHLTVPVSPILTTASRSSTRLTSGSCDSMGSSMSGSEGYVPFAEQMARYSARGVRPGTVSSESSQSESQWKPRLTQPKTPDFTSFRRKESRVKSASQLEEEQMEEMRKHPFKARPLNKRVLESCGDLGVPRIDKKPLTNPREPQLRVSERAEVHRSRDSSLDSSAASLSEASFEFKAQGVPKSHSRRPKLAAADHHKVTPPLATKTRAAAHRASLAPAADSVAAPVFKAAPMPDFSKTAYLPRHEHVTLTEPSPFKLSTEERHRLHEDHLRSKMLAQRQAEEESRKFKANPVRTPSETGGTRTAGPVGGKAALTETQPFHLESEARHDYSRLQWEHQVDKELQEERERFSSFHARPVPKAITSRDDVFTPRRSSRALTEVENFELNVDRRSREREHFEEKKLHKELRVEQERREEEERRKEAEERELRDLRRNMVVRARPVPNSVYTASFDIQRSTKPLTEPQSPQLRTSIRLGSSHTTD